MNDIQYLIDRQLGIVGRYGYDSVLRRLVVREAEAYHGQGAPGAEDPPIFACRFAEASGLDNILALANEDGRVVIQDISKPSSESVLEGYRCHNNAVFDLVWRPGYMNFVTVSGDHTACLWDAAEGGPRRVLTFSQHTRSVKTAAFRPEEPHVFATGARDGHILVWDARAGAPPCVLVRPEQALVSCHARSAPRTPSARRGDGARPAPRPVSVTGLVFQRDDTLLSCGECDGNIKVWDLRRTYSAHARSPLPRHALPYAGGSSRRGYSHLLVDAARARLYASCVDHVLYCYDVATYSPRPERCYRGHENASFYIKAGLSPDGRYLVSGSSDTCAYVWDLHSSRPLLRLAGHRAEVTCVAWARAPDPVLVTCSDDARHMVWRVPGEDLPQCELRGRAERAPSPAPLPAPHWEAPARPPHASPAPARKTKRCLTDLFNSTRDSENAKRQCVRPTSPTLLPTESKRGCTPPKRPRLSDETETENAPELDSEVGYETPTKTSEPRAVLSPRSPNTLQESPGARVRLFAAGLADYVRSGEAPHLRLMSPPRPPNKRKLDAPDWLTQLARNKRPRATNAPTAPTAPAPNPPTTPPAPPRRSSTTEKTPKSSNTRTLLKYFTIAAKEKV